MSLASLPRRHGPVANVRKSYYLNPSLEAGVKAFMADNHMDCEAEAVRRLISVGLRLWRESRGNHLSLDLADPGDLPRE